MGKGEITHKACQLDRRYLPEPKNAFFHRDPRDLRSSFDVQAFINGYGGGFVLRISRSGTLAHLHERNFLYLS